MVFKLYGPVMILLSSMSIFVNDTSAQINTTPAVTLQTEHTIFPIGDSVPVEFDYHDRGLVMDGRGIPMSMDILLISPDGKEHTVPFGKRRGKEKPAAVGFGAPVPPKAQFVMPVPVSIRLRYDLNRLFSLDQIGEYTVRITRHQQELARYDFRIVSLVTSRTLDIDSRVAHPTSDLPFVESSGRLITRLQIATAGGLAVEDRRSTFLVAKIVPSSSEVKDYPSILFRAPLGTQVTEHAVDFRWHLWTVLEHNGKTALLIWDLREGTVRTALSWSKEKIVFGTTRANSKVPDTMLVIAGRSGEPMMTTLSECSSASDREGASD